MVCAGRVVGRTWVEDDGRGPAERTPSAIALSQPGPGETPPPDRPALQALMWEQVGIVRDEQPLRQAIATLSAWQSALPPPSDRPGHELTNLVLCGRLTAEAALLREESRGAHYRRDFPEPREEWRRHIVYRNDA